MKKISIVMPVYNEEKILKNTNDTLKSNLSTKLNYDYEIIYVNDGSVDNSWEILKDFAQNDERIKTIKFSRNFGTQNAIIAGLKNSTGDAVVIMDADLQDPIEVVYQMIEKWENGIDIVYGKRTKRLGEGIFKRVTAKIYYKLLNLCSDYPIPEDVGEFRLMDRKVVNVICNLPEHNKFLRGLIPWCGFKQEEVKYVRKPRDKGKSKFTIKKMFKLAKDGIFSFSTKPIEIIGKIGLWTILLSFIILVYSVYGRIFRPDTIVKGWTSLICTITFFSGTQLVSLWVMSQYMQRIYDETKKRPNYIIEEILNNGKNKD